MQQNSFFNYRDSASMNLVDSPAAKEASLHENSRHSKLSNGLAHQSSRHSEVVWLPPQRARSDMATNTMLEMRHIIMLLERSKEL